MIKNIAWDHFFTSYRMQKFYGYGIGTFGITEGHRQIKKVLDDIEKQKDKETRAKDKCSLL